MATAAEEPLPDDAAPAELVYPLTDDAWDRDEVRSSAIDHAVDEAGPHAARALELGSFSVVAGTADAIGRIGDALPPVNVGGRSYPLRLSTADAWHTPLRSAAATAAAERIGSLTWDRPNVTLVDGRATRFTPWSTDPAELAAHSLVSHAEAPYDFARAFRVALREYAPEVVLLPGPGASLGAACAQLIVAEGYRGIRSRSAFEQAQRSASPVVLSMGPPT